MRATPEADVLRGKRAQRKHITRSDLLAAGRKLFSDKGLYESRIEDLASEAGIAKGTLYGYFANKDELVLEVVRRGLDDLLDHVRAGVVGARSRSDLIARVVEAHVGFFVENPDLMRLFHQVRGLLQFDRPQRRPLRSAFTDYLAGLAEVLPVRRGLGERARGRRLDVARFLFGAVSGVASVRAALAPGTMHRPFAGSSTRALVRLVLAYESDAGARPVVRRVVAGRRGRGPSRRAGPAAGASRIRGWGHPRPTS